MTLRRLLALCFTIAAALGPGSLAAAQGELGTDLITSSDLSPEQVQQIEAYARQWLPGLASDEPEQVKRSRERLMDVVRKREASVRFRQVYSQALLAGGPGAEGLARLSTGDRERTVINALLLASEVATSDAARLLVDHLADQRPAVRFTAVSGLKRLFTAVQQSMAVPAITPAGVVELVGLVSRQIPAEQNPRIVGAAVRALVEAVRIVREGYEQVRQTAATSLGDRCAERAAAARQLDPDELTALIEAGVAARNAVAEINPRLALGKPAVTATANLAGHALAYMMRYLKDFPPEPSGREDGAAMVQLAEAITVIAVPRLSAGTTYVDSRMAEDFRKGTPEGDRDFHRKATEAIRVLQGLGLGPFLK